MSLFKLWHYSDDILQETKYQGMDLNGQNYVHYIGVLAQLLVILKKVKKSWLVTIFTQFHVKSLSKV